MSPLALSLVSHTNVGKTTLARTLLGRYVGDVRDAAHVTEFADEHLLLRDGAGHELRLWDTPGFGDSTRLVRRLRQRAHPLGWFLSEVWDRWRDRPFWAGQQVLRHVRERSDVLLYLVNAAESPASAGHVMAEMELLDWVGKPVLVLLNQLGPPREGAADAAEVQAWADALRRWPQVKAVLPLDAFARCWVQEAALWQAVHAALPPGRQPAMAALQEAWQRQRQQVFEASMQALAGSLARVLSMREELDEPGGTRATTLRQMGSALGLGQSGRSALDRAEHRLARRLDDELRLSTDVLLRLHGLAGDATPVVLQRVATLFLPRHKLPEGRAAWVGGMLSGALGGLAADLAAGGLTLGAGLLAGSLLGALGAAGVARGLNVVRGTDRSWVGFSADALAQLLQAALLRYLAVAHFGRGRGDWVDAEAPPHWLSVAGTCVAEAATTVQALGLEAAAAPDPALAEGPLAAKLQPLLARCTWRALIMLYPSAGLVDSNNPPP